MKKHGIAFGLLGMDAKSIKKVKVVWSEVEVGKDFYYVPLNPVVGTEKEIVGEIVRSVVEMLHALSGKSGKEFESATRASLKQYGLESNAQKLKLKQTTV